jgi:hypothetical protein
VTQRVEVGTPRAPSPLLVDVALFSVALMWASTFTLFKSAWREIDPVAFTALRFAAMVAFSIAVLGISTSRVPPRRADLPALVASGLTRLLPVPDEIRPGAGSDVCPRERDPDLHPPHLLCDRNVAAPNGNH